jgi:hypothetical protein
VASGAHAERGHGCASAPIIPSSVPVHSSTIRPLQVPGNAGTASASHERDLRDCGQLASSMATNKVYVALNSALGIPLWPSDLGFRWR